MTSGERGLLGLAFHPQYPTTPYIYVNYVIDGTITNRISRFTLNPNNSNDIQENTEFILLEQAGVQTNHKAGGIAFGPDGYLYIGMGDGGAQHRIPVRQRRRGFMDDVPVKLTVRDPLQQSRLLDLIVPTLVIGQIKGHAGNVIQCALDIVFNLEGPQRLAILAPDRRNNAVPVILLDHLPLEGALKDWDNDSDLDLLIAGTQVELWLNDGLGHFTKTYTNFGAKPFSTFAVGDINKDGYLDIYASYADLLNYPTNQKDQLWLHPAGQNLL